MIFSNHTNCIMKKLSIIIPAYNVKKYLNLLIDSIYQDKVKTDDFEVIIVDDGSNDGTAELCDELSCKYANLTVIHQNNSGSPAGPRNKGVLNAQGKYVFFADSDDYFYPNAIRKILEYIGNHERDVVLFKVDNSDRNDDYHGLYKVSKDNCSVYNSKIMNSLGPYKLFNRELIVKNDIVFPEKMAYEDLPFVMECYMRAKDISIVSDMAYYKYCKREEGGSLTSIQNNAIFGKNALESRIKGIRYYFEKCSSLAEAKQCPYIYKRGYEYTNRLLKQLCRDLNIAEIEELKDINKKYYCDEIRSLLPFSLLHKIDALVYGDFDLLKEIVESWPDGPDIDFWYEPENDKQYYKCRLEHHPGKYLTQTIPMRFGAHERKSDDPHITRNLITETRLTKYHIMFRGRMSLVRKLDVTDEKDVSAVIRIKSKSINKISQTKAEITNLIAEKCYASVWRYEFDWGINLPLTEFMDEMSGGKQEIAFFLDVLVGKIVVEDRFGHRRENNVIDTFFENAVLYQDWVLAPKLTGYNNISLDIIPRSMIEEQAVVVNFVVDEAKRKIDIVGNQGFDNYLGTKIFAMTDDSHLNELQKGIKKGEREFKGSITETQIDNHLHTLRIKSEILGGALEYHNLCFSYMTSVRHITLKEFNEQQEKIRLLEEKTKEFNEQQEKIRLLEEKTKEFNEQQEKIRLLEEKTKEFNEQQEKIRLLEREINALKNSNSWKITKPLRDIASTFRKM